MNNGRKAEKARDALTMGVWDNPHLMEVGELRTNYQDQVEQIENHYEVSRIYVPRAMAALRDNIEFILSVSTENIKESDGCLMEEPSAPKRMMEHDENYGAMFDCCSVDEYDLQKLKEYGFSVSFIHILQTAHLAGFDRVYFDRDAPLLPPNFEVYNWHEQAQ